MGSVAPAVGADDIAVPRRGRDAAPPAPQRRRNGRGQGRHLPLGHNHHHRHAQGLGAAGDRIQKVHGGLGFRSVQAIGRQRRKGIDLVDRVADLLRRRRDVRTDEVEAADGDGNGRVNPPQDLLVVRMHLVGDLHGHAAVRPAAEIGKLHRLALLRHRVGGESLVAVGSLALALNGLEVDGLVGEALALAAQRRAVLLGDQLPDAVAAVARDEGRLQFIGVDQAALDGGQPEALARHEVLDQEVAAAPQRAPAGRLQLGLAADIEIDASLPAAGGGFHHDRVAEPGGRIPGLFIRPDAALHRHPDAGVVQQFRRPVLVVAQAIGDPALRIEHALDGAVGPGPKPQFIDQGTVQKVAAGNALPLGGAPHEPAVEIDPVEQRVELRGDGGLEFRLVRRRRHHADQFPGQAQGGHADAPLDALEPPVSFEALPVTLVIVGDVVADLPLQQNGDGGDGGEAVDRRAFRQAAKPGRGGMRENAGRILNCVEQVLQVVGGDGRAGAGGNEANDALHARRVGAVRKMGRQSRLHGKISFLPNASVTRPRPASRRVRPAKSLRARAGGRKCRRRRSRWPAGCWSPARRSPPAPWPRPSAGRCG